MKQINNTPDSKTESPKQTIVDDKKNRFISWVRSNKNSLKGVSMEDIKNRWNKTDETKSASPKHALKLKFLKATLSSGLAIGAVGKFVPLPNHVDNFRDYLYQQGENRTEKDFTPQQITSIKTAEHNKLLIYEAEANHVDKTAEIIGNDEDALKVLYHDYIQTMNDSDMKVMQYRDFKAIANQKMFGAKSKNPISWIDGSMSPDEQVLVQLGRFQTKYSYDQNGNLIGKIHDEYDFQTKLDASAKQVTRANSTEDIKVVASESLDHARSGNVLKTVQTLATLPGVGKPFDFDLTLNLGKENAALYQKSQDSQSNAKNWLKEHGDIGAKEKNDEYNFKNMFTGYFYKKINFDISMEMQTIHYSRLAYDVENYLETKKGFTKAQIHLIKNTESGIRALTSFGDIDTPHIVSKAGDLIADEGAENYANKYYQDMADFKVLYDTYKLQGMTPQQISAKIGT